MYLQSAVPTAYYSYLPSCAWVESLLACPTRPCSRTAAHPRVGRCCAVGAMGEGGQAMGWSLGENVLGGEAPTGQDISP